MLRNFLVTALRNLKRNKVYALLNIFGLALGIGCALVIFKVITYELSYDKFHSNYDQIYRVVKNDIYPDGIQYNAGVPHPLGVAIRNDISDVKNLVRTHYSYGDQVNTFDNFGNLVKHDIQSGIVFTEPELLEVFDFEIIYGNAINALGTPNQAVVSKDMVKRLFGDISLADAVGKKFNLSNKVDLSVGAVMENVRKNTVLPFEIMISYDSQKEYNNYYGDGNRWNSTSGSTNNYLMLDNPEKVASVNKQFKDLVIKYKGEEAAEKVEYYLQPMSEVHFDGRFDNYESRSISRSMLMALGVIGLFLVITACINFINLATAQAVKRSKEIGIRKAIGVSKRLLITQFMSETFIITLISVIFALAIGELLLYNLVDVLGYSLHLDMISQPKIIVFVILVTIFVSVLSGFYPSFLLSRLNTILALKNKLSGVQKGGGISLRRALVIVQFAISQVLIIGTLVVGAQMEYFYSKDLGFTRDAIITTYLPENNNSKTEVFRNKMLESSLIKDVSFSLAPPRGNSNSYSNFNNPRTNSEDDFHANFKAVDHRYMDFFGLELLAGRKLYANDSSSNAIINRKVFDLLGLQNPEEALGLEFSTGFSGPVKIVGVIENFHTNSLRDKLDYVFLVNDPDIFYEVSFKFNTDQNGMAKVKASISHFEKVWEEVYPEYLFSFEFYDEQLARNYEDEKRIAMLFQLFSAIAIFIGCLGLYGLISFIASQRLKEIGVRKVLGASVWNILNIFSRELVYLLILAFVIAAPLSFYFMNEWLEDFEYRIPLGATYFIVALIASLLIAIATIGYKTYFTAIVNPVVSLKDE